MKHYLGITKTTARTTCLIAALGLFTVTSNAMPIEFEGTDGNNSTVNSDNAFNDWANSVNNNFILDNLDGIGGPGNSLSSQTTDLGNNFTGNNNLFPLSFTTNVLQGAYLRVAVRNGLVSFTWNIINPPTRLVFLRATTTVGS